MFTNLVLGSLVISGTVLVHTVGLILISKLMVLVIAWFRLHRHSLGRTIAMISTVVSLFVVHTVEIWAWAAVFIVTGAITELEESLYFSTVTFSTLGYGDVILSPDWRLLSALEAISGFTLIGWSTAYLVAASTRYGPFRTGEHF